MPFKWKFFRFNSYFHIAFVLLLLVVLVFGWKAQPDNSSGLVFIGAALAMCVLFANCINNLILLARYYPEKLPGKQFVVYTQVLLVLSLLVLLGLGIITGYGIYEEVIEMIAENKPADSTGLTMAAILFLTTSSGIYASWNQVVLRKTIRRNFNLGIDSFLSDDNP